MDRIFEFPVTTEYEGHKLSEMLRGKGFSRQTLTNLKYSPGSVLLDGQIARHGSLLNAGQLVTVRVEETEDSEKIPPVELPLDIVYEDEDLLVVNKPAGMPIHPSMKHYENTLGNAVAWYYQEQGKHFVYRCINRLDKDTTGLTIIAKNMVSCGILYAAMEKREIHRTYYAIVSGLFEHKEGIINLPLGRKPDSAIERMVDYEHGDRAITHYRILSEIHRSGEDFSYVECKLETGRTHQIRVHMKAVGHPLLGDFLYNESDTHLKRQALHAGDLDFIHPISGERIILKTPLPEDMRRFLDEQ